MRDEKVNEENMPHIPVMRDEVLEVFEGIHLKVFVDCTLGAGGHASEILKAHPEIETYIGCDRDENAINIAKETLKPWQGKVQFHRVNHVDIEKVLDQIGIEKVDGFFLI